MTGHKHELPNDAIRTVAAAFDLRGDYVSAAPYGSGHINDTYAVVCNQAGTPLRYILQRINHTIFTDPPSLMDNILRVTQHIRSRLDAETVSGDLSRRVLTLVPAFDGRCYHQDADGNTWRVYLFIEGAQTYDQIESTQQAYEAARAFGAFQRQLCDLPGGRLTETIPGFHDTRHRFDALRAAMEEDACDRVHSVTPQIDFAMEREKTVDVLLNLHRRGDVPEIVTHSDTKLNNVMIDDATSEGICVIDLDTVMPGLSLYDFGDMARTATRPTVEDETDLSRVEARMDMFEALTRGYLSSAGTMLNRAEIEHLPFAARLITFEIGIRFLTDYLQGDVYFKTHREGHNLDRCRVQFKMVESLEAHEEAMRSVVRECAPR